MVSRIFNSKPRKKSLEIHIPVNDLEKQYAKSEGLQSASQELKTNYYKILAPFLVYNGHLPHLFNFTGYKMGRICSSRETGQKIRAVLTNQEEES